MFNKGFKQARACRMYCVYTHEISAKHRNLYRR